MESQTELEFKQDSLYMLAAVKLQHERGGAPSSAFDEILDRALAELDLDGVAFNDYLEAHREELDRTMEAVGF